MRTTTPREIIQKARIRADMVYSNHTSDTEALILLDDAYKELFTLMVSCDESLFAKTGTLTLVDFQAELPQDLYKVIAVSYNLGGIITKLQRISIQDRQGNIIPGYLTDPVYYLQDNYIKVEGLSSQPLDVLYIPTPAEITSLDQTIQLIHNEDQYLQGSLWRDIMVREESDTKAADIFLATATMRIKNHITPRANDNVVITDVYALRTNPWSKRSRK